MVNKAAENKTLKKWQRRLEDAKTKYADARKTMKLYEDYYNGERTVRANPNTGKTPTKVSANVRNIVYELIESQVDVAIPMPKVRAIHAEDDELAKKIEHMLENKIITLDLAKINDLMERVTPVQGADFFYVQWDPNKGLHSEIGDLKVTEIHPKKLIPQPGMTELEDMDYFFIQEVMTKNAVKKAYGVDVSEAENDQPEIFGNKNEDIVTVTTAMYKNEKGGIGCYTWCDTFELLDIEEYQARQLDHCAKCGTVMQNGVCPSCGGKKAKKMPEDYEEIVEGIEVKMDITGEDGRSIKRNVDPFEEVPEVDEEGNPIPQVDENGNLVMDTYGQPVPMMKKVRKKIPYYKPNVYPVVQRRNISDVDKFLGKSDSEVLMDQQDTIKKLGDKINEKLLKGGSYVTLPNGKKIETNDKELKIIRVDNAQEAQLVNVINVQPNVSNDLNYLEQNYNWAKSTSGISDSFQGKYDASATSGTAKQYSINQSAGRLESKRTMKNTAFAKLYELMFKFWLAYADQDTEITSTDASGQTVYEGLNRKEFLRMDANQEFYWDDEFIFTTDPTSTLMQNREMMWQSTDMKLQSGAFGQIGDLETSRAYWTIMKANGYPNASVVLSLIEARIEEQKRQQAMMQQMGGGGNMSQIYGQMGAMYGQMGAQAGAMGGNNNGMPGM